MQEAVVVELDVEVDVLVIVVEVAALGIVDAY